MKSKITLEILWWCTTALLVLAVLFPIKKAMRIWEFETLNIFFVVGFITLLRHVFFFEHVLWARLQMLKIVVLLLMFPVMYFTYDFLNRFIVHIDNHSWTAITGHLPASQRKSMENYLWTEMLIFGIGTLLAAPALAARLFLSIWRQHNRGTV